MAIDVQVIFYLIDKLNADKSPGADGIHQRGLEELKGEIGGLWAKTCKSSLQRECNGPASQRGWLGLSQGLGILLTGMTGWEVVPADHV